MASGEQRREQLLNDQILPDYNFAQLGAQMMERLVQAQGANHPLFQELLPTIVEEVLCNESHKPTATEKRTREILQIMAPGGGYVASASHDTILEETPVENVLAMFDAVEDF